MGHVLGYYWVLIIILFIFLNALEKLLLDLRMLIQFFFGNDIVGTDTDMVIAGENRLIDFGYILLTKKHKQ